MSFGESCRSPHAESLDTCATLNSGQSETYFGHLTFHFQTEASVTCLDGISNCACHIISRCKTVCCALRRLEFKVAERCRCLRGWVECRVADRSGTPAQIVIVCSLPSFVCQFVGYMTVVAEQCNHVTIVELGFFSIRNRI